MSAWQAFLGVLAVGLVIGLLRGIALTLERIEKVLLRIADSDK